MLGDPIEAGVEQSTLLDASEHVDVSSAHKGYGAKRNWLAELTLGFVAGPNKTVMKDFTFKGPLRVQRPFYPEGAPCHVYLLHPPGGLVSGDNLKIDIECAAQSHALITTPSAGKIYQADTCNVAQHQTVSINVIDAVCEWLPQETIVFNGANGCLNTEVDLTDASRFIGWDIYCLGRTAGKQPFEKGSVVQTLKVVKDGLPLLIERQAVKGDGAEMRQKVGFAGNTVSGTLIAYGVDDIQRVVDALRNSLDERADKQSVKGHVAVTQRLGLILVRYLGPCSEEGKNLFIHCWKVLRKDIIGLDASEPRIWAT